MSLLLLCVIVLTLINSLNALTALTLNAYNQIVYIQPNTEIIINLYPSNTQSNVLIATLPAAPLYTVSPNYITYGYTPAKWAQITANNTYINNATAGNTNTSVVYNCGTQCKHDRFTFQIYNSTGTAGNTGIVDLIFNDNILIETAFNTYNDQFDVVVPSAATPQQTALYSATTIGLPILLSNYIYNDQIPVSVNKATTVNQRWYFSSNGNAKYNRNLVNAYNGAISFNIGIFAGDFITPGNQRALPLDMIQLVCGTCADTGVYAQNTGITLSQRQTVYNGETETFTFTLAENNGWLKDPQDTRVTNWPTTNQCELLYVLSGLSEIRIFGAYTYGYEVIGIDDIIVSVNGGVPTTLYLSPPNAQCTSALS